MCHWGGYGGGSGDDTVGPDSSRKPNFQLWAGRKEALGRLGKQRLPSPQAESKQNLAEGTGAYRLDAPLGPRETGKRLPVWASGPGGSHFRGRRAFYLRAGCARAIDTHLRPTRPAVWGPAGSQPPRRLKVRQGVRLSLPALPPPLRGLQGSEQLT